MKTIFFLTAAQYNGGAATSTGNTGFSVVLLQLSGLLIIPIALMLLFGIWIILCRIIAKQKNISKNYMWFGLLGIIGLIVVVLIPRDKNTVEKLMEQKQLLDLGVITAEEFEESKRQMLEQQRGNGK